MSVLVTVVGPRGATDLELDDTRAVGALARDIAILLGEPAPAVLGDASGAELPPASTLASAGVLDGHLLTLVPAVAAPAATAGPATAAPVLVCYLAIDTSDSMAGAALEAAQAELARLWAAARADQRLADRCHLGVVTFDERARVVAPLTPVERLNRSPRLAATRPATNYEAAFRLVRRQLDRDLAALRSAGRTPLRPWSSSSPTAGPPAATGRPPTLPWSAPRVLTPPTWSPSASGTRPSSPSGAWAPSVHTSRRRRPRATRPGPPGRSPRS